MNYLEKVINDIRALQTILFRSGFLIWSISSLLIIAFTFELSLSKNVMKILIPLSVVSCLAFLHNSRRIKNTEYLLFFSISITSLFGLTQTLTGSHAEGSNILLYGLSFYTASIAYLIAINSFNYLTILETTPAPIVRPPSRIANRIPFSIATG